MKDSNFHTDSIHCALRDAMDTLQEIKDKHGETHSFAYELHDDPDGNIENAYLVTDEGEVFRISVTRIY